MFLNLEHLRAFVRKSFVLNKTFGIRPADCLSWLPTLSVWRHYGNFFFLQCKVVLVRGNKVSDSQSCSRGLRCSCYIWLVAAGWGDLLDWLQTLIYTPKHVNIEFPFKSDWFPPHSRLRSFIDPSTPSHTQGGSVCRHRKACVLFVFYSRDKNRCLLIKVIKTD